MDQKRGKPAAPSRYTRNSKKQSPEIDDSGDVSGRNDAPAPEGPRTRTSARLKAQAPDVANDQFTSADTIYFYENNKPYYGFTNFSPHEVTLDGKVYPTSEHLFQAMKFLEHKPLLAEHIRCAGKQPRMAFNEAHRFASEARKDWFDVRVKKMEEVVKLKFEQHSDLKDELLKTGEATLVEDARANDSFWGNGADGKGGNELGKALMRLRTEFRSSTPRL